MLGIVVDAGKQSQISALTGHEHISEPAERQMFPKLWKNAEVCGGSGIPEIASTVDW